MPIPSGPAPRRHARRRELAARWVPCALVLVITAIDALTPAGIVVGIFLTIPVLLSSMGDEPGDVLLVSVSAVIGFVVAAIVGRGAISPAAVWIPNRVFVTIAIVASCPLSLVLQRRRLDAEAARLRAERARDASQLLQSLMAHDLRAPLALSGQALQLARSALAGAPEATMLHDVELRVEQSLSSVDRLLAAARSALPESAARPRAVGRSAENAAGEGTAAAGDDAAPGAPGASAGAGPAPVDVAGLLRDVVNHFDMEARLRGKVLTLQLPARAPGPIALDAQVVREVVSILVENALRHADPGPVRVSAAADARELRIAVADSGPGFTRRRAMPSAREGTGLGLKLSRLLAARAGGTLALEKDDPSGSTFVLRLPIHAPPTPAGRWALPRWLVG